MKRIQCTHCKTVLTIDQILPGKTYTCVKCGLVLVKTSEDDILSEEPDCPYCGTAIQNGDISVFCPVCRVEYHQECWIESEGCTTYGCSQEGILKAPPMKITQEMLDQVPTQPYSFGFPIESVPQPSLSGNTGCLEIVILMLISIIITIGF